jgi:hypothetical protein
MRSSHGCGRIAYVQAVAGKRCVGSSYPTRTLGNGERCAVESYGVSPVEILTVVSLPFALVLTVVVAWRRRAESVVETVSARKSGQGPLDGRVSLDGW